MNFAEKVKSDLWTTIDEMAINLAPYVCNPERDFKRKKKWDFATVVKFMISMESQSLKNELHKYWGYSTDCPTNSSFNQRRSQILPSAFEYLFHQFTDSHSESAKDFKGYRLIACDGSDINIAYDDKDHSTFFPATYNKNKGFNQLHLNAMYDLIGKIYVDAIIQPGRKENEENDFCEMIDKYSGDRKTIFIADRGYESYNSFAHAIENNVYFLIRGKDITSNGIISGLKHLLPKTDEFDRRIKIILTPRRTNEIINNPQIYKSFYNKKCFDYTSSDDPYYKIALRIARFKIADNKYECVITNLDSKEFSARELKELYAKRWGIETSFRELKYAVGLSCFHSKKTDYILQEIWSRLILYNFCQIITMNVAINKCTNKYTYQLNFTFAIHVCRFFISKMAEYSPPDIEAIISKELLPIRPGRHDPRKIVSKHAVSFLYRVA